MLFLLSKFCLVYTVIFQMAASAPPSLKEGFPVLCFPIFFLFRLFISYQECQRSLYWIVFKLLNYFLIFSSCNCCDYFKSSSVINRIFSYLHYLFLFLIVTWNFILSLLALQYPIPYHFAVMLFYFIYVLIKLLYSAMCVQGICLLFWFWVLPDRIVLLCFTCTFFPYFICTVTMPLLCILFMLNMSNSVYCFNRIQCRWIFLDILPASYRTFSLLHSKWQFED